MKRRILIFSMSYYPRLIGGAEVAVKGITDRISPDEIEFDMITLGDGQSPKQEMLGNVNVFRVFNNAGRAQKLLFPFVAAMKAKSMHRNKAYDTTWAIMASYAGYAAYIFKRSYPSVPMVLTIQEGDNFDRREGMFNKLFRKIFTAADSIQVISNYLADWSRHMGATCPITVIPNAVDFAHFAMSIPKERRQSLRQSLGFNDNDLVMVTASRLVYKNAIDDIIGSLPDLPEQYKLLILGSGPDEAKLKAQVKGSKVSNRVVFKGFVQHSELPQYLQASEIFVRPSRSEGLGNSFLEAMAAGIPVIATAVGGIPDFLTDGETGLFCEVGNPHSIAQKAEKLMKDRESREYIVGRAKEMVRNKYGWDKVARDMQSILTASK